MKTFKFLLCLLLVLPFGLQANEFEGTGAGASVTSGYYNAALGQFALNKLTTGYRNAVLGERAGFSLTTGYGNVLLGAFAGYALTTSTNKLYITNMPSAVTGIFGDFTTGYFGVNDSTPSAAWDVWLHTKSITLGTSFEAMNVVVTDSSSTQSSGTWTGLRGADIRAYKRAGDGAVEAGASQGSPSGEEMHGAQISASLVGGTLRNVFGVAGNADMASGTTIIGHVQNPAVFAGGFFRSFRDSSTTLDHAIDVPLIGQVTAEANHHRGEASAAIMAMLVGATADSAVNAVAAFRVGDYSKSDNFDYGLDLTSPDVDWIYEGSTYQKFDNADIRLINGETIDNSTDGITIVEGLAPAIYALASDTGMTMANYPSGSLITNGSAGAAVELTLPAAVAGLTYIFVTTDIDSLNIIANSGSSDNIDHAGGNNVANYCAVGQIGETVTLTALDGTSWQVISETGTWGTY